MKTFVQLAIRVVGLVALAGLGACGGGGGGGASGGGNGGSTFTAVSVSLKSPGTVTDTSYSGMAAHSVSVEIGYSGNLSALAGRTVYTKAVQTDSVYVPDQFLMPLAGTSSVFWNLYGNDARPLTAGQTIGTVQVYVCLDANCATQLQGSPLVIDYAINALPGLELSTDHIDQSVNYGATAPVQTITVTPPAAASSWSIVPTANAVPGADPSSNLVVPPALQRSGNTLTFQPPANLPPGKYAVEFQITTNVADPVSPTVPLLLKRKLTISHTVVATGPYAITPASADLTRSLAALDPGTPTPTLVSQVGGTFSRLGVRTDSFPPAAAGSPLLANWLAFFNQPGASAASYSVNYCNAVIQTCLPVGTYQGALLLRHTAPDGTVTDFEFPVTLNLTP